MRDAFQTPVNPQLQAFTWLQLPLHFSDRNPFFYSGTIPFLNRFTYPVDFAVKFTTAKTSGASVPGPGPLNKTCAASSACSNTSTPACPIKAIIRPTTSPCSGCFRVGCLAERPYGTTTWFCTPGLVISAPSQPSYCSPQ